MILGDYYRFPSEYFRKTYESFMKRMLLPLIASKLIDDNTFVILPRLNRKLDTPPGGGSIYSLADDLFLRRVSINDPIDNPLYLATDNISAELGDKIFNSPNAVEIKKDTYDRVTPFYSFQKLNKTYIDGKLKSSIFHMSMLGGGRTKSKAKKTTTMHKSPKKKTTVHQSPKKKKTTVHQSPKKKTTTVHQSPRKKTIVHKSPKKKL